VVIETPRGASVKLKYEPSLGAFTLSRPLAFGIAYPFDWGFVPGTCAPDGDPLDAMLLLEAPTFPGVVVVSRPIGVIELEQNRKQGGGRERNDRLIVVPRRAPRYEALRDAADLPARVRTEIEQFFLHVTALEDKDAEVLGWRDARTAFALVERCTLGEH
jgi:inorganic pyrophosphatase